MIATTTEIPLTHMITISGAEYHLAGPSVLAHGGRPVVLADIAHHLALINRFTGATYRPYSVAEHSLLCCDIGQRAGASAVVQLALLLHDAHEAYVTDLSSPAKVAVDSFSMGAGGVQAWGMFEDEHAKTVRKHFNLLTAFTAHKKLIREIDLQALATERRDLTAWREETGSPWAVLGDRSANPVPAAQWIKLDSPEREAASWKHWRDMFVERYNDLRAEATESFEARIGAARAVC